MPRNPVSASIKDLIYRANRRILAWLTHPASTGKDVLRQSIASFELAADVVYVLPQRGLTDLIVLDLVATENDFPSPMEWLPDSPAQSPQRRFFCLTRASGVLLRRNTMQHLSPGLTNLHGLHDTSHQTRPVILVPVTCHWGRIPDRERSIFRLMLSEQWAVTSRFRRFFTLIFNRRDILVQFGEPLDFNEMMANDVAEGMAPRRTARLLRRRFANQRRSALGPDLSHQRTLVDQIVASSAVRQAVASLVNSDKPKPTQQLVKLSRKARKDAQSIASNMSYTVIRFFDGLLRLLWTRMYDGVVVNGIKGVREHASENTLVYVPCHRSHIDYLLLSYQLFHAGLSLPHIAAGDNLNMPIVGPLLRRGGAFFMRRRFRDDRIYSAVFNEYLYQVYRRGHSVEYFIEGGRSRSGRLLPPQTGILNMTLEHNDRGLPKPLVFVPVYFAYERLIESGSYLNELRGAKKKGESLGGLFSSLKLLKQPFGEVTVNFGTPLKLNEFINDSADLPRSQVAKRLGEVINQRINGAAHVTPINLISLITLATPRIAISEGELLLQLDSMLEILAAPPPGAEYTFTAKSAPEIISYVESLQILERESTKGAPSGTDDDILSHDAATAVLMTWYRNNVLHLLALPSLIACLIQHQDEGMEEAELENQIAVVYPYLRRELSMPDDANAHTRHWLQVLTRQGLLLQNFDTSGRRCYAAPPVNNNLRNRLYGLSQVIMQTLERQYIVVATLANAGQGVLTRAELEERCQSQARRMSRLQGLNAPEFFDIKLIRGLVTQMFGRGVLFANAEERLNFNDTIHQVANAAIKVISEDFRQGLSRG